LVSVERVVVSKSLIEAMAKAILFSRTVLYFTIKKADFVKGVYRVELSGLKAPDIDGVVSEQIVCKDIVDNVLDRVAETRDNDLVLLLEVWKAQGFPVVVSSGSVGRLLNPESVTRARRIIQNDEGRFLPTSEKVATRRGVNEELLREFYGGVARG